MQESKSSDSGGLRPFTSAGPRIKSIIRSQISIGIVGGDMSVELGPKIIQKENLYISILGLCSPGEEESHASINAELDLSSTLDEGKHIHDSYMLATRDLYSRWYKSESMGARSLRISSQDSQGWT